MFAMLSCGHICRYYTEWSIKEKKLFLVKNTMRPIVKSHWRKFFRIQKCSINQNVITIVIISF